MIFSNLLLASVAAAGVVHMPLVARELASRPELHQHLHKRALPNEVYHGDQTKGGWFYEATLELGTPAQSASFCFDTGSGHLWVPGANSTTCLQGKCRADGQFNITQSSTWRYQDAHDNWGGHGINGLETVGYAGQTLDNFTLWVSLDYMMNDYGIFGQSADSDPTLSFVQGLAHAKKISRSVYSLNAEAPITIWNGYHGSSEWKKVHNNVYYGGYDQAKYEGPLVTIDVDHYGGYAMPMSGFAVDGEHVKGTENHQIVLDTGGITLTLPNKTVEALSTKNGGHYNNIYHVWTVDCNAKPVVSFEFGYTAIDVEMDQYITRLYDGTCGFQRLSVVSDDQQVLLNGPPIISKALVIYDNDRSQIHIARAKYTDESNVVEITGDIPHAVLYKDWLAGKPLPAGVSSIAESKPVQATSKASTSVPSTLAVKTTSAAAPHTSSVPQTSAAPVHTSSAAPVHTSSSSPAAPSSAPAATPSLNCGFFGIFCVGNDPNDGNDNSDPFADFNNDNADNNDDFNNFFNN